MIKTFRFALLACGPVGGTPTATAAPAASGTKTKDSFPR